MKKIESYSDEGEIYYESQIQGKGAERSRAALKAYFFGFVGVIVTVALLALGVL